MTARARPGRLAAAIVLALILAGDMAGAQAISTDEESLFGSSNESNEEADSAEDSVEDSGLDTSDLFGGDVLVTAEEADDGPAVPAARRPSRSAARTASR